MRGTSDMELLCDMIDVFLCMIMIDPGTLLVAGGCSFN